jgi:hypothetical protein
MLMDYCFASCLTMHFMHCIMLTLAHIQPFHALDQAHVEPEPEVQAEQAQAEGFTNIVWIKASPGALTNDPCLLLLNLTLCSFYDCALSL